MRLRSHEEEKPSVPVFDTVVEESEEPLEQARIVSKPGSRRFGAPGRAIRSLVVAVVSVGIFAGIVSSVTGVSLWEWLQGADFKQAYSMSNLAYARGTAAERVGDLSGATSALLSLRPDSSEAQELSAALFPKLLKKGDFKQASTIVGFVKISQVQIGHRMSMDLGQAIAENLGLTPGLAFITKNSDLNTVKDEVLSSFFLAIPTKELLALEQLAAGYQGAGRSGLVESIANAYSTSKDFERAWNWASKLSGSNRERAQNNLLIQFYDVEVEATAEKLLSLPESRAFDDTRKMIARNLFRSHPALARKIVASVVPGPLRENAKSEIESLIKSEAGREKQFQENLKRIDAAPASLKKASGFVSLAVSDSRSLAHLDAILTRLENLAKTDLSTIRLHDDLVRYVIASNRANPQFQRYADRVIDADARAALKKEVAAGGPTEATLVWSNGKATVSANGSSMSYSSGGL